MKLVDMMGPYVLTTPFQILKGGIREYNSVGLHFSDALGLGRLAYVLDLFGVISAIVMILCALITLMVVNYPKTVMQTKQRVVHALFVIILTCILPFMADVVVTIMEEATFGR